MKTRMSCGVLAVWAALCVGCLRLATAEEASPLTDDLSWAIRLFEKYPLALSSDITYRTANNFEAKLDVFQPLGNQSLRPTVMFIHGGGWIGSFNKNTYSYIFLPVLQRGWIVVNVDYRPSSVSPAPAAVEDCLCALRWIGHNAPAYHIDLRQLVIMGQSAGGLLALTTGMIPPAASGIGGPCDYNDATGYPLRSPPSADPPPRPAAIVNWSGPTDMLDQTEGPHQQPYAVIWLGGSADPSLARKVSPLSYVRAGLPPIVSVYGDRDIQVPYDEGVRLHSALSKAGVTNKLITIAGAEHGIFGTVPARDAWLQVFDFLQKAGVTAGVD